MLELYKMIIVVGSFFHEGNKYDPQDVLNKYLNKLLATQRFSE